MTRIALDPGALRHLSRTLRVEGAELDALGRRIARRDLPEMPPGWNARSAAVLRRSERQLSVRNEEIEALAAELLRRASIAQQAAFGDLLAGFAHSLLDDLRGFSMLQRELALSLGRLVFGGRGGSGDPYRFGGGRYWNDERSRFRGWTRDAKGIPGREYRPFGGKGRDSVPWPEESIYGTPIVLGEWKGPEGRVAVFEGGGRHHSWDVLSAGFDTGAKATMGSDKVAAEATASASAMLAQGGVRARGRHGAAEAGASAGAKANAKAKGSIGTDGVRASAGVDAHVGAEAHASASANAAGVHSKATAGVSAGLGGKADFDAKLSTDSVKIKVAAGLTVGLGLSAGAELELKPKETLKTAERIVKKIPKPKVPDWPF